MTIGVLETPPIHAIHLFENGRVNLATVLRCDDADFVNVLLILDAHTQQHLDRLVRIHSLFVLWAEPLGSVNEASNLVFLKKVRFSCRIFGG